MIPPSPSDPSSVRAAEYVRMSTEGQQYSIANQQPALREYAAGRGFTIVRTYADEGKSGHGARSIGAQSGRCRDRTEA